MRYVLTGGLVLLAFSGSAVAGGFERSDQSVGVLFEKGRLLELGGAYLIPEASGVGSRLSPTPGRRSGDIADNTVNFRFAFKDDINESLSYAVIFDQPYGSNITYPRSSYFASDSRARLTTNALTAILQYNLPESVGLAGGRFSIFGGARAQQIDASASIPFLRGYSVTAGSTISYGYVAGAAWERPDLGMRVSLSYFSKINSDVNTTESFAGRPPVNTTTELDTPSSLTLEAQTGLNPKTLLYGSVRYVPWGNFAVTPPLYGRTTGSPLAFFKDDRVTYRLGVGRRLNESWSVFGEIGFETSTGSGTTNLTPADGFVSGTLGVSYKIDRVRTTLAVRYADVGDADTILGTTFPAGQFRDSSLLAIGLRFAIDLN